MRKKLKMSQRQSVMPMNSVIPDNASSSNAKFDNCRLIPIISFMPEEFYLYANNRDHCDNARLAVGDQHCTKAERKHRRRGNYLLLVSTVVTIFALAICQVTDGQMVTDCSDAPNEAMRRLRQIDTSSRQRFRIQLAQQRSSSASLRGGDSVSRNSVVEQQVAPPAPLAVPWQQPIPVPANARGQWATHPYDCMTLQCLCPFFGGRMQQDGNCYLTSGRPLAMAYRKEYRMMSDNERQRFHYALTVLKTNGEYDRLSAQHLQVGTASGAHSGPGFLPWHREYLKRVEIAIRLIDPDLAIPYWDSVIDGYLPDPRDSMLHSASFIGETDWNGFVVTGPFAYWRTLEGRGAITRHLAQEGSLFTEAQLNGVMQQTNIEYVMAYTVPTAGCPYPLNYQAIEYTHSNIHLWLGGDMKPPATSANDPIFFLHHSFVDLVWESWRQLRQPRWVREWAYAPDLPQCANPLHFSYAQMVPFNLINRDGLSNSYTDQMYRYAPRPGCSAQVPTCGSPYLFCDLNHGFPHCVAKVKMGGLCQGFEGQDICFNGMCWFGRCIAGSRPTQQFARFGAWASRTRHFSSANETVVATSASNATNSTHLTHTAPIHVDAAAAHRLVPFADCYDRNPCCARWADGGECTHNKMYMQEYCAASCGKCKRSYNVTADCMDHHKTCATWARNGECTQGKALLFMQENCRQSCGLCAKPKCSTAGLVPALRPAIVLRPPPAERRSPSSSLAQREDMTSKTTISPTARRLQPPPTTSKSSLIPMKKTAEASTERAESFRRRA